MYRSKVERMNELIYPRLWHTNNPFWFQNIRCLLYTRFWVAMISFHSNSVKRKSFKDLTLNDSWSCLHRKPNENRGTCILKVQHLSPTHSKKWISNAQPALYRERAFSMITLARVILWALAQLSQDNATLWVCLYIPSQRFTCQSALARYVISSFGKYPFMSCRSSLFWVLQPWGSRHTYSYLQPIPQSINELTVRRNFVLHDVYKM